MLNLRSFVISSFALALFIVMFACGDSDSTEESGSLNTESSGSKTVTQNSVSTDVGKATLLAPMMEKRRDYALVVLSDGRLLVMGGRGSGRGSDAGQNHVKTTEIYDAARDKWTLSGEMHERKTDALAVELKNGKVLVVGGAGDSRMPTPLTETWDPSTGEWTKVASMVYPREKFALIRLGDGRVLAMGGSTGGMQPLTATAEIYDPETDVWTLIDPMGDKRIFHTSTVLNDGRVLVTGGGDPDGPFLKTAEVFDPVTEKWQYAGEMTVSRTQHTATLMADGRVLIVGGRGKRNTSEIYDPVTNTFGTVTETTVPRSEHIAIANSDGSVLVAGGTANRQTIELYDPISNNWSEVGDMRYSRYRFNAFKRDDGSIMLIGGQGLETVLAETEVVNVTLANRSQADLDANAQVARSGVEKVALNATPTPLPTPTPPPERREAVSEGVEFSFPEAIESDPTGTTTTPLGQPVRLAIGQTVVSPGNETGMQGKFVQVKSDDRDSGGAAVVQIELKTGGFDYGSTDLTLEATGGAVAKKISKFWIGLVDLEYDSDNNPIAIVVVFKP